MDIVDKMDHNMKMYHNLGIYHKVSASQLEKACYNTWPRVNWVIAFSFILCNIMYYCAEVRKNSCVYFAFQAILNTFYFWVKNLEKKIFCIFISCFMPFWALLIFSEKINIYPNYPNSTHANYFTPAIFTVWINWFLGVHKINWGHFIKLKCQNIFFHITKL